MSACHGGGFILVPAIPSFISSYTCSFLEADLPYSTGETTLQKEFSNFGKIAEGKCMNIHNKSLFTLV